MKRKGIILAGGCGTRLAPLTIAMSKQLMPVYDKPMIYYPLSVLMLAGIREILIISTPQDLPLFQKLLQSGEQWGLSLSYAEQQAPRGLAEAYIIGEKFLGDSPSAMILGDNLFYGESLTRSLDAANTSPTSATIFAYHVADPQRYGIVELDSKNRPVSIEEKPASPKSSWAVPGLYFYDAQAIDFAKQLKPSARGELEITDIHKLYLKNEALNVQVLGRGIAWLDTGTHDSLLDAAHYVEIIQKRQNLKIACLEEIALRKGWVSKDTVQNYIQDKSKGSYYRYISSLLSE